VFRRTCHRFLSWARWIQSTPSHPVSLRSILILSSYLSQTLPSGFFPSGLKTKIMYAFIISPMHFSWFSHPVYLYLIILMIFGEYYKLWSSSLYSFTQPPVIFAQNPGCVITFFMVDTVHVDKY
jgi:hypothetical protein